MINLRSYQNEARYAINTLANAKMHPCFVSPTGSGKTATAVVTIQDRIKLGRKVFVLTPTFEIFSQFLATLSKQGLNPGYINDKGIRGRNRDVYVCMPMSLANLLPYISEKDGPDEIVEDECHHSLSSTRHAIYNHFNHATRIGLTATPYRMDNKPLGAWYTNIVQTITPQEAIDAGYLVQPLVIVPEEYKLNIPLQDGELDIQKQADALGKPQIVGNMIEEYADIFAGLPVLVACAGYDHAAMMCEAFRDIGWNFEHIHGELPRRERAGMIKNIRSGKLNGLCTVNVGQEGLDLPGLYGLIWMRRTMSLSIYLQMTGRILRPLPGKQYGIILDGVGNTFIHGRPEMDRKWSLKTDYAPEPEDHKITQQLCPACGVMNSIENTTCHVCGLLFDSEDAIALRMKKKRGFPAMVDGNLVILEGREGEQHRERIKIQLDRTTKNNEKEEKPAPEPIELGTQEKVNILNKSLTGGNVKSLFKETLRDYL